MWCNKNYQDKFDEKLKERFFNTYNFSRHGNKGFILLLRKGVYPYEYMNYWEKFNGTSLPEKNDFYSQLNMEDITDADYAHAKRVFKDFETKNLGAYHALYVQTDRLLLVDVFENFRNIWFKIYILDPTKFHSAPGLAWQRALKKTKVRVEICHPIHQYAKANNKYINDYDKNKELSYIQYWNVDNLYA